MTDAVQLALIAAVPPTLVALGGIIVSLHNKAKIQELHVTMNSKLDLLVKKTAKASFAAGKEAGAVKERQDVVDRLAAKGPRVR